MPVKKTYPQLDKTALAFLMLQVRRQGSISAVARDLGYSRPTVSLALAGKYPGDVRSFRAKLFKVYSGKLICPHTQRSMDADECHWWRTCDCPTYSNVAAHHWLACKTCINNPDRKEPSR